MKKFNRSTGQEATEGSGEALRVPEEAEYVLGKGARKTTMELRKFGTNQVKSFENFCKVNKRSQQTFQDDNNEYFSNTNVLIVGNKL